MAFILTTDTSCDAFKKDLDAAKVPWIPLTFTLEGQTYDDNFSADQEYADFYAKVAAGAMPTTSQINTFSHEEFFNKVLAEYKGLPIVHLTLSGGLSETVNSARVAAKNIMDANAKAKVYIVDTLSATQGHNIIVDKGIELRDKGVDPKDAAKLLEDFASRVMHFFMVNDLHHLKRGGRVSAASAAIGTLLNIKPLLTINHEGKLVVIKKAKGAAKAIAYFLDMVKEHKEDLENGAFYIVNANAHENSDKLRTQLKELYPHCPIKGGWVGPVIGAHTGEGMFGVAFVGKKRLTDK